MKWLIAACAVLIALGIFVDQKTVKISGDDIVPLSYEKPKAVSFGVGITTWTTSPMPSGTNIIGSVGVPIKK